jgi:hypothetical protein
VRWFLHGRRVLKRTLVARRRQSTWRWCLWRECLALCEGAQLSIVVEFILVVVISKLLKVDLVAQNGADATEALHELVALG